MVLAFYYMWYFPGRWGDATFTPFEFYDSKDEKTIFRHCEEAKKGGIDGFIISFWGIHEMEKLTLAGDVFDKCGIKYTIYLEVSKSASDAIKQIDTVLKVFGKRKGFLRIDGKSAIFIYGRVIGSLNILQLDSISKAFKNVLIFADGEDEALNIIFGNLHRYIVLDADEEFYKNFCKGVIGYCAVPVFPGFKIKNKSEPYVDHENGEHYKKLLKFASRYDADILLITSFNEWWEGTNVEPSKEFGDLYLMITKEYSELFRKREKRKIARKIQTVKIKTNACFLGEPKDFTPLIFENSKILKDPQKIEGCNILIYAGDENYDTSWNPYILDYLNGGNKMLITGGPFPFYYDKHGKYVNMAKRFGLEIRVTDDRMLKDKFYAYLLDERDSVEFLPRGENRIREILKYNEEYYRLKVCKEGDCKDFVISGRIGNVYYVWSGLVKSSHGFKAVKKVLKKMGF